MGTKSFKGRSRKDVDGRADSWLAANPQLRNVQMQASDGRAEAAGRQPAKSGGRWSITLSFDD